MKPILIVQHLSADGPAYLARWLRERGLPFQVFDSEAGQTYPDRIDPYAALAILGGEMSANDALPSLRQAENLIRQALALGVPTIGHCLGAQLMARALEARVVAAPVAEIGWQPIAVADTAPARDWLGTPGARTVFQWHYETFELPAGADLLATSAACRHQAFALGPHIGLQFHLEVDAGKITLWSHSEDPRAAGAARQHGSSVQDGSSMRAGMAQHLASHQILADRIYGRWLEASC
jgi:GMP synthase (glutamine-hydrolysing)